MIEIKVDGQIASVQETLPLYSGSAEVQSCHFIFGSGWDGFEKSAVFRVGSEAHTKLVDDDGCCVIPWELLTHRNVGRQLEIGMYGVSSDTEILTSVWDTLGVIREGAEPGDDARNPVDGVYEQILAKLGQIKDKVNIYDGDLLALIHRAETAAGLAGESAQSAKDNLEELRALVEEYRGVPGRSAYQYALDGGFIGTEEEFAAKLAQEKYSREEADEKFLTGETDPSVPAWAKEETKPSYTADEVGLVTESWTFTLEDGSAVTKEVYVG